MLGAVFSQSGCVGISNKTTREQAWEEFTHPQDSTRTKVWWFHGEAETTKEGITADLEGFKRAGIGGVVYYGQAHGKGKNILTIMSQEWWDILRFAASEAKRIGLSFEINMANNYVADKPGITPEVGMQRLTATETTVKGRSIFKGVLPTPGNQSFSDVAVLAFPVQEGCYETNQERRPDLSSNLVGFPVASLFDLQGQLYTIPAQEPGHCVFINLDFREPFAARSITYRVGILEKSKERVVDVSGKPTEFFTTQSFVEQPELGQLEVSDDGIHYRKVCDLKRVCQGRSGNWEQKTISFPMVEGRYFRLNLHDWYHPNDKRPQMYLGNVLLSSQAKTDQWEEKSALYSAYMGPDKTPEYADNEVIAPGQIIDLTSYMDKEGQLQWEVPEGKWKILRFVHVPTGGTIQHSCVNTNGLEYDKLSATAAKKQFDNCIKPILDSLNVAGCPLKRLTVDCQESGPQNWTSGYEKEFLQRRGYDMRRYLPALMGYIVGSPEETDAFFHDMRHIIAELVADKYYGTLDSLCREAGVHFTTQVSDNGLKSEDIQPWLNRNYTFREHERSFWDGQARCAALMGKGIPVADLCVLANDNGLVRLPACRLPEIPEGYDFDICTAKDLIIRMKARDGRIIVPDGVNYQMLVIQHNGNVTLEVLRHIASLVEQGVPLYGPKPLRSGSLIDSGNAEEYSKLADCLWGNETVSSGTHIYGKGKVYWGMSLAEALSRAGIRPDIVWKSGNASKDSVRFAHRRLRDAEVYFLNNHSKNIFSGTVTLRTNASYAEYWEPVACKRSSLPATPGKDGLVVTITLQPGESGFVVASDYKPEG